MLGDQRHGMREHDRLTVLLAKIRAAAPRRIGSDDEAIDRLEMVHRVLAHLEMLQRFHEVSEPRAEER